MNAKQRMQHEISNTILEMVDLAQEVSRSDLQGIVEAEAMTIIDKFADERLYKEAK